MSEQSVDSVAGALRALGRVWVYVEDYRMTHRRLHLLLTNERFDYLAKVYFGDTLFISGKTSGGPWECTITSHRTALGTDEVLFSAGSEFLVRALEVRLALPPPDNSPAAGGAPTRRW